MKHIKQSILSKRWHQLSYPFYSHHFLFCVMGFANDITNPMVKAFSKIFRMSATDGALVQVAFYGGYLCHGFSSCHVHPQIFL